MNQQKAVIHTKTIVTIGPASDDPDIIDSLVRAGADIFRLNTSHGDESDHERYVRYIRDAACKTGAPAAIMVDLQGPKIRVGFLARPVTLREGQVVTLVYGLESPKSDVIPIDYDGLTGDVKSGDRVLINDGRVELEVIRIADDNVIAKVTRGGEITSRKGVNLPGSGTHLPSVTERDERFISFAVRNNVDFIALSFVRSADTVLHAKQKIQTMGGSIPVIAKIEKPQAVTSIDSILDVADGIMVARGDLGVELSQEDVPIIQKHLVQKARIAKKVVIVATQMLESMITEPVPTRAETNDVANAVIDGADALMLSGETAVGRYPLQALEMMNSIAAHVESNRTYEELYFLCSQQRAYVGEAHHHDMVITRLFNDLDVRAVIAITESGYTARLLSKARIRHPIVALCREERLRRRMSLLWGVVPVQLDLDHPFVFTEEKIHSLSEEIITKTFLQEGDPVVFVGGMPYFTPDKTSSIRVYRLRNNRAGTA